MTLLRLAGIGATFVVWVLAGIGAGLWAQHATGQSLWVLAGLFAGIALGGFLAFREFARYLS
jgi:hypothetical protein